MDEISEDPRAGGGEVIIGGLCDQSLSRHDTRIVIPGLKAHFEYSRLLAAMKHARTRAHPWKGTIYRSAPPKWAASRDMLTGAGSMMAGSRYNAAGTFPAVYGSTTPELAMIESLAYQRRAGLPVERAMPLVFKAIAVSVERLLDLTDRDVLAVLGVKLEQLRKDVWWVAHSRGEESLTQAIGRVAHTCAIQAFCVASAHSAEGGVNVVLLPDHIQPPSGLHVLRRAGRS